jgi:hypothetical protein
MLHGGSTMRGNGTVWIWLFSRLGPVCVCGREYGALTVRYSVVALLRCAVLALECHQYTNAASGGGSYGDTAVQTQKCDHEDDICVTWSMDARQGFDGTFGQCISSDGCSLVRDVSSDTVITFCEACSTDLCNPIIKYHESTSQSPVFGLATTLAMAHLAVVVGTLF